MNSKDIETKIKELLLQRNNPTQAYFDQIEELTNLINEDKEPILTIKILLLKAMGKMVKAIFDEVHDCYLQIESIRIKHPEDYELQALALRSLGTYYWNNSDFHKALEAFLVACNYEKHEMNLTFLKQKIGMTYFKLNDFENAFVYFNEAYKNKDSVTDLIAKADIISWYAIIHNEIGMFEKSQVLAHEAMEINLKIENYTGLAANYNTIGLSNKSAGNIEQALGFFKEAEKYASYSNSFIHLANACNNIASIYQHQSEKQKAIDYFEKSLEYRKKTLQYDLLAVTLKNLITLYIDLKLPEYSEKYLFELEALYQKLSLPKIHIMLLYGKALLANYHQDYQKAVDYFLENLKITEEINYTINKLTIYDYLSIIFENLNDYQKSLEYHKLIRKVLQEINMEDEKKNIHNLNIIHQIITDQFMIDKKIQEEKIKTILAMAITVNHEINQPLMQIQGNLEMLINQFQPRDHFPKHLKYCNRIQEGIDTITNLTDKFLNNTNISFTDYLSNDEMIEFNNKEDS